MGAFDVERACRDVTISSYMNLSHAFATIGLLRQVTDSVSPDLVLAYVYNTNQPWPLRWIVGSVCGNSIDYGYYRAFVDVHALKMMSTPKEIPAAVSKMAKEYLVKTFWEFIDHIRMYECMRINDRSYDDYGKRYMSRIFPRKALNVLGSINIQPQASLYDIRNAVTTLHAVITPTMVDRPDWLKEHGSEEDRLKFDTLRTNHQRILHIFSQIIDNYCMSSANRSHIPNHIEKNILLDLFEVFLVMFGPMTFHRNFSVRQVYEMSKIAPTFSPTVGVTTLPRFSCGQGGGIDSYPSYMFKRDISFGNNHNNGVDMHLDNALHLSPEAALCVGQMCGRENGYSLYNSFIWNLSKEALIKMRPVSIIEVELFLYAEYRVQSEKACRANNIFRSYKASLTPEGETQCKVCADEPCAGHY